MQKSFLWIGAVALVWLFWQSEDAPSVPEPNRWGSTTFDSSSSYGGSGGSAATSDDANTEEVQQAKEEFQTAAEELRASVEQLRYNRWDGQMSTIRNRLEDADDALGQLEALRPGDPAVQSARDEVDNMRSHLSRLQHENWRTVRPDLDSTSSAIEDDASSVSDEPTDE